MSSVPMSSILIRGRRRMPKTDDDASLRQRLYRRCIDLLRRDRHEQREGPPLRKQFQICIIQLSQESRWMHAPPRLRQPGPLKMQAQQSLNTSLNRLAHRPIRARRLAALIRSPELEGYILPDVVHAWREGLWRIIEER